MKNNYKKKYIDIKRLSELVPHYLLPKINLLFNKDVPKEPKTANELLIYKAAQIKETNMQQFFHQEFKHFAYDLMRKNKFLKLEFVQNDNGDSAGGQLTQIQRMALYSRKKAEGSKEGFPDVSMYVCNQQLKLRDTFFCEVKKIGAPSEIHISESQLEWFLKLNDMGFSAYITNNPIFFKNVILKEIGEFLK